MTPDALADGLYALSSDPALRREPGGGRALQGVRAHYTSRTESTARLLDVYTTVSTVWGQPTGRTVGRLTMLTGLQRRQAVPDAPRPSTGAV